MILHTLHPALEDGTDRGFRNVGKLKSDAGEIPKRIHTIFKTRRKSEIKSRLTSPLPLWAFKACSVVIFGSTLTDNMGVYGNMYRYECRLICMHVRICCVFVCRICIRIIMHLVYMYV